MGNQGVRIMSRNLNEVLVILISARIVAQETHKKITFFLGSKGTCHLFLAQVKGIEPWECQFIPLSIRKW